MGSMTEHAAPAETEAPETPKKKKATGPAGPPSIAGALGALVRRPALVLGGAVACGVVSLLGLALGPSAADSLFNLASYLPILGGAWAVWSAATASEAEPRGQLPTPPRILRFAATALVVVILSGLARVTLTVLGELVVKTALALGPTVALAEMAWPPAALWGGVLVIDKDPRAFLKLAGVSAGVLLLTVLLVPWVLSLGFGGDVRIGGGGFVGGTARGLGWAVIAGLWMRHYLLSRAELVGRPAGR